MKEAVIPAGLTVDVSIGGKRYDVPAMVLDAIDRVMEAEAGAAGATDFKTRARLALETLSFALWEAAPDLSADVIRKRMLFPELLDWMSRGVPELMRISGLSKSEMSPGEAAAVGGETSGSSSTS